MLKILGQIPRCHFHVACSGGSDSMVLVDFLKKFPQNDFDILHFNHGTEYCQEAENFVVEFCKKNSIKCYVGRVNREKNSDESREEYWREQRYAFFAKYSDEPILMAHHLKDVIETWVMTSLNGSPKLIPYFNRKYNIYRPFLCVPKSEIEAWIERHDVKYVLDKSNLDVSIKRNYVRRNMMKDISFVSPGIETIMKKKILDAFASSGINASGGANGLSVCLELAALKTSQNLKEG